MGGKVGELVVGVIGYGGGFDDWFGGFYRWYGGDEVFLSDV